MSTILDALRKLQRERSAANPSRDLRGSVTDEIPLAQPRRSRPRRGLALGVLAISLAVLAGVGGVWLYKRGVSTRAPAAPGQVAPEPQAAAAEQEEAQGEGTSDAELDREIALKAREADAKNAEAAQVAAPPPDVPAANADEAAAERARLEEVRRAAAVADEARRQEEARAQAEAEADAATAASAAAPPPAQVVAPPTPPTTGARPAPAPAAQASKPTPPVVAAKPKPKAKPAPPPPAPARAAPEPATDDPGDLLAATAFPEVRVESIRWHPLAERRAASLRFAQQNVADAHEGDIIGGVLVFRIEPGAVELKVGSTSRVVRPGP